MNTLTTSLIKKMLLIFLLISGLYLAKSFLIPLAIGTVLATLFLPFCRWLERKKIPKGISALFCTLLLAGFITGIFTMLGWQIGELANDFELIKIKAVETAASVKQYIFEHSGISVKDQDDFIASEQSSLKGAMQIMAGTLFSVLTNLILIVVYVFLLLYYRVHIKNFIMKLFPEEQRKETENIIYSATHVSQQYLVGLAKMIACLWVMYGIGFSALGVENALFFAVLCGLLEIIPFVGNITGTTLTLLVAGVNGAETPMLIGIVITYGIVQFIQGWLLEPLILGRQVKINPLFTIIALILGELVWGIPGIILAIPLIAMFKIVCDHIEPLKPYGFLIGEVESKKRDPKLVKRIKSKLK